MESGSAGLPLFAGQQGASHHARFETTSGSAKHGTGSGGRHSGGTISAEADAVRLPKLRLQTHLPGARRGAERMTGNFPVTNRSLAMKILLFAVCIVLAFAIGNLRAQEPAWQPSPGHTQVPIWPGAAPDAQPTAGPEGSHWWPTGPGGPGGFGVYRVSRPTITVFSPEGKNTGAAVVVFPGGGYLDLAIDLEGTEVCDWLTPKGITCVLLKYRVPGEPGYPKPAPYPKSGPYPESPMALEDAQRTLGLVRLHAAKWHIDPHKVGVLGFSAGGHLSAAISTHFAKRLYPAVDAADKESCRPDFAIALYPGHLSLDPKIF